MFIHKQTLKRINPYAPVQIDGVRYASYPLELLDEIPDPQPPEDYSEDTHYRTEQDDAPYVVFTRKSDEQIEQARRAKIQAQIDSLERESLLPRVAREFMLVQFALAAANVGADPMANFGYRKVKELDDQIAGLREQL